MRNTETHTLKTRETCNCKKDSGRCPVCDWGLGVCLVCNAAECQLDEYSCDEYAEAKNEVCHCGELYVNHTESSGHSPVVIKST